MEIIFFIAGVITSIVLTLLFLKKNNQSKKTFLDNEVNNDKNKYVTWSNALNLIKDQIIILNKNKVVIYANTADLTRFFTFFSIKLGSSSGPLSSSPLKPLG